MENYKPISRPMVTAHKLSKNDDSTEVNQIFYRSMIGKLQYVVHGRKYITLAVGNVSRFLFNPNKNHYMAMKILLRYLKGIKDYGLYCKNNDEFELRVYIGTNLVGNVDDKKVQVVELSF